MTTRSPFLMALAAIVLTACAMAMDTSGAPGSARNGLQAAPVTGSAQPLPFACTLLARQQGGTITLQGQIDAHDAVSGSYALKVRGPGVSVDQSGDLSLGRGASSILGEASMSGRRSDLDAALTVTAMGRTVACPLQQG